jgi:hypothetical protein
MDTLALNFNPAAVEDDGSCEYPIDCSGLVTLTINMSDSYGDGWNGNVLTLNGQTFTLESGSEGTESTCYDPELGCAEVVVSEGGWAYEVSWTITTEGGDVLLSGGSPYVGEFGGEGCGPVLGCTDETALNYNADANVNDGSCEYPCESDEFTLNMLDSYGDGWNGASLVINGVNYTFEDGFSATACVNLEGCNSVSWTSGSWDSETSWTLVDVDDNATAYTSYEIDTSGGGPPFGEGCVVGCTDPAALNYNLDADILVVGSLCEYPVDCAGVVNGTSEDLGCGCGNPAAQEGYDCDGNIVEYVVGMEAEGGIVFYVDETGEHGLVAAMEDLEGTFEWGCYGVSVDGADSKFIGSGLQNTMDIISQGCTTENGSTIAAQAALDAEITGYSDWYLPSKDELTEMYNTIGNGGPEGNIGGFENSFYWSSSENDYYNIGALSVNFLDGYSDSYYKSNSHRVRVIRAF